MNPVGLEQLIAISHAFEEERQPGGTLANRDIGEDPREAFRIGPAVIGWTCIPSNST